MSIKFDKWVLLIVWLAGKFVCNFWSAFVSYFSKWLHREALRSDLRVMLGSFHRIWTVFNLLNTISPLSPLISPTAFRDLRYSYSKYLLMKFFYLMKCRAYAIHLTHYWLYYGIIFFWTGHLRDRMRLLFQPGLVEIRLRTEQDLNLALPAIIICLFGSLFVSLESVYRSNLRLKSWL